MLIPPAASGAVPRQCFVVGAHGRDSCLPSVSWGVRERGRGWDSTVAFRYSHRRPTTFL